MSPAAAPPSPRPPAGLFFARCRTPLRLERGASRVKAACRGSLVATPVRARFAGPACSVRM
uniref:zinc finger domain-containing protein n=1 Tax=Methylobacterium sp. B34 TaxID=95563 RepID=UPI0035E3E3B7